MNLTPESEISTRIAKLQHELQGLALDAAVFVQNADLFYFTGTIQSGALYVPALGQPVYFVRKDVSRARRESPIGRIESFNSLRDLPAGLTKFGLALPKRVGFEFDVLPVSIFERYRKVFDPAEYRDISLIVRRLRMIKSNHEVELMKAAAIQADRVYHRAREVLRVGMTDIELAAELEHTARVDGHPGIIRMRSFNGEMLFAHVFSGPDSAVPAYLDTPLGGVGPHPSFGQGASWRRIAEHEPVIVDTGSSASGYLVDQTRILSIGELPEQLTRGYHDMLRIEDLMKKTVAPGVVWADVYEACRNLALEFGYADNFMGYKGSQAAFIGHGVGIEIDEFPIIAKSFSSDVFEVGMVFAVEPKVVFPGLGAVGIENTFVLQPHGLEQLTYTDEALGIVN